METSSESLSIESFSYSWLVNLKPSFESPKGSFRSSFDESNFIEMDPKLSASKRFLVFHQDFDFNLPTFQPSVHADELISNGILVPIFLNPLDNSNFNSNPTSPVSSNTIENVSFYRKNRFLSFGRCKRLPKRVVQKYLDLVRLIWVRMRRGKCEISEVDRAKRWDFSGSIEPCGSDWARFWVFESPKNRGSAPRISEGGAENWWTCCESESSIYEAVLHCKKTIGCK